MVIDIQLPKIISNAKQNQLDNFKGSLFFDLVEAAKEIATESDKERIIIINKDDVIRLGYKDKISADENLLHPIFKQVEKETGYDIEGMISEGKTRIEFK